MADNNSNQTIKGNKSQLEIDSIDDYLKAAISWSALCEPGDAIASRAIHLLGMEKALYYVLNRYEFIPEILEYLKKHVDEQYQQTNNSDLNDEKNQNSKDELSRSQENPDQDEIWTSFSPNIDLALDKAKPKDKPEGNSGQILNKDTNLKPFFSDELSITRSKGSIRYEEMEYLLIHWKKALARWAPRIDELDISQILEETNQVGATIITRKDKHWPRMFDALEDKNKAPFALWVVGNLDLLNQKSVSIVGCRACSEYGRQASITLAKEVADNKVCVVSGGAHGIDRAAHEGALQSTNGATAAVLCGGLNWLYPKDNEELFYRIAKRGMLLSECPPNTRPAKWRFLERNRLIAALSQVIIVVEAPLRSGSLATAAKALDLGRTVAAVPGNVNSHKSKGTNKLLQEGAEVITGSDDVFALLGLEMHKEKEDSTGSSSNQLSNQPGGFLSQSGNSKNAMGIPLTNLEDRVLSAFPLARKVSVAWVSKECGLSEVEVEYNLFSLKILGLVSQFDDLWMKERA